MRRRAFVHELVDVSVDGESTDIASAVDLRPVEVSTKFLELFAYLVGQLASMSDD